MYKQPNFFDLTKRYEALSKFGDPLEKLEEAIDFEIFRKDLQRALQFSPRLKGGRTPYDCVLMFKILIIQTLYNWTP